MSKYCIKCGSSNLDDATICSTCGKIFGKSESHIHNYSNTTDINSNVNPNIIPYNNPNVNQDINSYANPNVSSDINPYNNPNVNPDIYSYTNTNYNLHIYPNNNPYINQNNILNVKPNFNPRFNQNINNQYVYESPPQQQIEYDLNDNYNNTKENGFVIFLKSFVGKVLIIILLYMIIFGIEYALIRAFGGTREVFAVIALVMAYFGWRALNMITPNLFLIMPIGHWIWYFIIKGVISFFVGIFVAPYQIAKMIINNFYK
jgi:hypothetical protein